MAQRCHLAIRDFVVAVAAVLAVVGAARPARAQSAPGECLSGEEAELAQLVNQYRQQHGLDPVPLSRSLSAVAQWHVWDLDVNHPQGGDCNLHSWSDGDLWSPVCYTADHANASGMWLKPREITGGVYMGVGYEIGAFGVSSPRDALRVWQHSPEHDAVILTEGSWERYAPWPAMGVGMRKGYAVVWFGPDTDPQGPVGACGGHAGANDEPPAPRATIADAHPNPFNPRVTITLAVAVETHMTLTVNDMRGRCQRTLMSGTRGPGQHKVVWDGTSDLGAPVPAGVYVLVLESPHGTSRHKIALLR